MIIQTFPHHLINDQPNDVHLSKKSFTTWRSLKLQEKSTKFIKYLKNKIIIILKNKIIVILRLDRRIQKHLDKTKIFNFATITMSKLSNHIKHLISLLPDKSIKFFKHSNFFQFIRFSLTGGAAFLVHFLSVIMLVELGQLHPLNANLVGYTMGFIVSFLGHRYWTFSDASRHLLTSLPLFLMIAVSNFLIQQTLFYCFLEKLHLPYLLALPPALGMSAIFTFTTSKFWVFR